MDIFWVLSEVSGSDILKVIWSMIKMQLSEIGLNFLILVFALDHSPWLEINGTIYLAMVLTYISHRNQSIYNTILLLHWLNDVAHIYA